jgi:hypothetical protein
MGGLEQPLLAALLAWAMVERYAIADNPRDTRAANLLGILLGLTAWTRPDGLLFTATTTLALAAASRFERNTLRSAARSAAIAVAFFLVQLAFRRAYYEAWVPNTALVKVAFSYQRIAEGWDYVGRAESPLWCLVVLATVGATASSRPSSARSRGPRTWSSSAATTRSPTVT